MGLAIRGAAISCRPIQANRCVEKQEKMKEVSVPVIKRLPLPANNGRDDGRHNFPLFFPLENCDLPLLLLKRPQLGFIRNPLVLTWLDPFLQSVGKMEKYKFWFNFFPLLFLCRWWDNRYQWTQSGRTGSRRGGFPFPRSPSRSHQYPAGPKTTQRPGRTLRHGRSTDPISSAPCTVNGVKKNDNEFEEIWRP